MMDELKREKEIEKRERLVETFLIISGFLLAYAKDEIRQVLVSIFSAYLIFTIVYYIYVSRTKNSSMINLWGLLSAYSFSLLILVFINAVSSLSTPRFYITFITLTATLTFSLLSPESSDNIIYRFNRIVAHQDEKHHKLTIGIIYTLVIVAVIWPIYNSIAAFYKIIYP